jgi:DNA-binding response OmpR family regulator
MTKIMIVDDEPDLREMVDLLLHKEGFETKTAADGSEFLEKLDDFNPDIVILDVWMPGLTTYDILEKIKEKKSNPKIILLTIVRFSKEEIDKIFQSGNVIEYVTKPFQFNQLMNIIHKHIMDSVIPS